MSDELQWYVMSEEEALIVTGQVMVEMTRAEWEERERQARRDAFDRKHPRCWACGQFLGSKPHWYKSSWEYDEWDHI